MDNVSHSVQRCVTSKRRILSRSVYSMTERPENSMGPTNTLTRKVHFSAYYADGKWETTGYAWIKPNDAYPNNQDLLRDIDTTNNRLVKGSVENGQWFIIVGELGNDCDIFINRLIAPTKT